MKKMYNVRPIDNIVLLKMIKIMPIAIFFVFLSLSTTFAVNSYSQQTKLTLKLKNATLEKIFDEVEKNTEFFFLYNKNMIDVDRRVDIDMDSKKINDVLDELFKSTDISYNIVGRQILLIKKNGYEEVKELLEKKIDVSGTVHDSNSGLLPGVTVVIKGTAQGTITDVNGMYSLDDVPDDATLVFSFIGMKRQEIPVSGKTTINVTMVEETIGMEEVVVVGYGTQKKINLTGSVDAVSGDMLQNRSAAQVSDLIKGTSANLNISMNSQGGEPGAESKWNIRGLGSINGNADPLILVDGVEMNINNIDPESIESFSVLKDASASAIYGSRAPFGVILITTKRGTKNKGVEVQYNNNVSAASPVRLPHFIDALTWATVYNQVSANTGQSPVYSDEQIERIKGFMDGSYPYEYDPNDPINKIWNGRRYGNANYDWPDEMIKDFSFSQKHNVNISGGDDKTQYYISLGTLGQEGLYEYGYDNYKRSNILANLKSEVTDWLSVNLSTKFAKSKTDYPLGMTTAGRNNFFLAMLTFAPMMPKYNVNGTIQNPLIRLMQSSGRNKTDMDDFVISLGAELEPVKGWKTNVSYNYNLIATRNVQNPKPVLVELGTGEYGNIGKSSAGFETMFAQSEYNMINAVTSYEKQLDDHFFKVLAGYEQEEKTYANLVGTGDNVITEEVPSISTALGVTTIDDKLWHWATQGVFGRLNYNYQEKYLLEVSARYNGSSRFAEGSRWGLFPSFSAGYNISRENFWAGVEPYVNTLKIRGSYGSLGNQNVDNYLYLSTLPVYIDLPWIIGDERPLYARAPSLVSSDLTWETITTLNFGLDAGFLNNRLELNFDWFDRVTTDMLGPAETLPYVLGADAPQRNNAELSTKGFELKLSWKDQLSSDFSYNVQVTLGDNKSKILKYKNDVGYIHSWYEGKTAGEMWGYITDGLIQSEDEEMPDQSFFYALWGPGDIKYKDLNGDEVIDPGENTLEDHGDLTVIGNSRPRYNYSISAGFNWKGFDFSMFWQGVGKQDYFPDQLSSVFWGTTWSATSSGLYQDSKNLDYWRPADETNLLGPNTDAYFAKPYFNGQQMKNRQNQSRYVLSAAYLRLKNLQIGYTIPERLSKKVYLQKARIYFSGENLLLLSALPKNMDPETTVASDVDNSGYYATGVIYPISRTISLGLNLTF